MDDPEAVGPDDAQFALGDFAYLLLQRSSKATSNKKNRHVRSLVNVSVVFCDDHL